MKGIVAPVLLLAVMLSLGAISQCYAQTCPDDGSAASMDRILDSPESFIACEIRMEGVLETEDEASYSIRTGSGRALGVWSWAPPDPDYLQYPSSAPDSIKPMSYFVGRQLRLSGQLVKERGGRVVLEVSSVEELDQ